MKSSYDFKTNLKCTCIVVRLYLQCLWYNYLVNAAMVLYVVNAAASITKQNTKILMLTINLIDELEVTLRPTSTCALSI